MQGKQPDIIRLYRILHIDNVEYLLTHGMFTRQHANADPGYINIGDVALIKNRSEYQVTINPPNGVLGDYVPFYLGPLSPMLLRIKDGHNGVTRRPQREIVYVVCRLERILAECQQWCFTNGHAKNAITEFYNDTKHLDKIDWDMVGERYWKNTEDDFDRMRRKQAEFLVKEHVPVSCIAGIVTYDAAGKQTVDNIVNKLALTIPVIVNPNSNFYYA